MEKVRGSIVFDCEGTLVSPDFGETEGAKVGHYAACPGIMKLLQELRERNFALYVWTARGRASTLALLKGLDMMPFFWDLRCVDDTTPKPHPQALEELVGDQPKDRIVMIGDSFSDIQGAKSFGCYSIAAAWTPYAQKQKMLDMGPDFVCEDTSECLEMIERLIPTERND